MLLEQLTVIALHQGYHFTLLLSVNDIVNTLLLLSIKVTQKRATAPIVVNAEGVFGSGPWGILFSSLSLFLSSLLFLLTSFYNEGTASDAVKIFENGYQFKINGQEFATSSELEVTGGEYTYIHIYIYISQQQRL